MADNTKNYSKIFPPSQRVFWEQVIKKAEEIQEIRIRVNKTILVYLYGKEYSVDEKGNLNAKLELGRVFSYGEIQELVDYWCQDSRYAFQEELKRGYLTIKGGHRIGICGELIFDREQKVQTIKYISSLNIRIAHQIKGVSKKLLPYLYEGETLIDTLLISPPGCGKTTLLRDLTCHISNGNSYGRGTSVGVVDERGELAACYRGIPQLEIGSRSDVLDGCPKVTGMLMLLRSMSPGVIVVDELGNEEEIALVEQMVGRGCHVLATIHGSSLQEVRNKKIFQRIWENHIFRQVVILEKRENCFSMAVYKEGEDTPCFKS